MRRIPRRAKSISRREVSVRLLLTLAIYSTASLTAITFGLHRFGSFVSLADSRPAVESRNENRETFAFLTAATVSSTSSIDSLQFDPVAARRNHTTAFSMFAPPVPQPGDSKIVFTSNRDGSMQIYVMNGDGSGVARLTNSGANDDFPRWSPNGSKIPFQSDRDHLDTGYMDIYLMNADGSGVLRLASDANDDSKATWSPDGSKIVFQSMRNGLNYQVYSMNADGSSK